MGRVGPAKLASELTAQRKARTGFTQSQRIVQQCEGLGVDVVMGNQIDGQIGSLCSAAFGAAYQTTARAPRNCPTSWT
ncbi:hypothetical protein ACIGMX_06575 [Streptomyces aquilus]|uniref:hypothetical protein n=1 Tax=Streptomyces aquilus TaxID=2548456 RepID=UPI0037D8C885